MRIPLFFDLRAVGDNTIIFQMPFWAVPKISCTRDIDFKRYSRSIGLKSLKLMSWEWTVWFQTKSVFTLLLVVLHTSIKLWQNACHLRTYRWKYWFCLLMPQTSPLNNDRLVTILLIRPCRYQNRLVLFWFLFFPTIN